MIKISYIPDPPIYIYQCTICKKEIKTSFIKTCLICKEKICKQCYKEEFCINHYNMLSSEGKKEFNRIENEYKDMKLKFALLPFFGFITWIIWFILSCIFYYTYGTYGQIWFYMTIFIILMILLTIIPVLIYNKTSRKLLTRTRLEKVNLFENQKKEGKLIIDSIDLLPKEKNCQLCGRDLKQDAVYCDSCGFKL